MISLNSRKFRVDRKAMPFVQDGFVFQKVTINDVDTGQSSDSMVTLKEDGSLDIEGYGFCEDIGRLFHAVTGKYTVELPARCHKVCDKYADFTVEDEDFTEALEGNFRRVCEGHLTQTVMLLIREGSDHVLVGPLNKGSGFKCEFGDE